MVKLTTPTPADETAFQQEAFLVHFEDGDEKSVHVDGFHAHPQHGGQQEVMQEHGHKHTDGRVDQRVFVRRQEEERIQHEEGQAEVDQNLARFVVP